MKKINYERATYALIESIETLLREHLISGWGFRPRTFEWRLAVFIAEEKELAEKPAKKSRARRSRNRKRRVRTT